MASAALKMQQTEKGVAHVGGPKDVSSRENGSRGGGARKRAAPPEGAEHPAAKKGCVPLEKVLEGVVFALSGFKNPFRGELREKGMEMGALYQADWGTHCTHLV